MQQMQQVSGLNGIGRERVETVVETLATLRTGGDSLAEVAHDARNMVTALGLYCDLLQEPGVLATPYLHYGNELRLVAAASRRLVEKLVSLDSSDSPASAHEGPRLDTAERQRKPAVPPPPISQPRNWDRMPAVPIDNLAAELLANRNLLAALAGPAVALTVDTEGGALPVRLTAEDLTRILVNLIKNAAEAMPTGGRIQVSLSRLRTESGVPGRLLLTVDDSGPGIAKKELDHVFQSGFTTQSTVAPKDGWSASHRGLGLSITRAIVEAAGGRIYAGNHTPSGARLSIELPVRTR